MSIKHLHNEIEHFLGTEEPETICIKGKWGVGKTFTWNYLLEQNVKSNNLALQKYSYISLFGIRTLRELKYGIFEATLDVYQSRTGPDENTLTKNYNLAKQNIRRLGGWFSKSPLVQSYIGSSENTLFFTVREQIICIDDLDRLGGELTVKDILGMISFLKEQRKCKIVLLLNQEELKVDDLKLFDEQIEKVADIIFEFKPTPKEAANIVFADKSDLYKILSEHCVKLGIVNIRVLKKIERNGSRLSEILSENYPDLLHQAMHTVVLLTWVFYQPKDAPSINYILSFNRYSLKKGNEAQLEQETSWWNLLLEYNFMNMDAFDNEIFTGINAGYFDLERLLLIANDEYIKIKNKRDDVAFHDAWELYHNSFENNVDLFLDRLFESAIANINNIHPANMNSTVTFLREFGRNEEYNALISKYVQTNPNAILNLDKYERNFWDITDKGLLEALKQETVETLPKKDLSQILASIYKTKNYSDDDLTFLMQSTTEEFYAVFISATGEAKNSTIKGALYFGSQDKEDEKALSIFNKSVSALKKIALTNPLNAKRVAHFGIVI
jgi:hypothetical protein